MKFLYRISFVIYLAHSAVEYLTKNEQIRFFFPTAATISIEYWLPRVNLESFDWVGFGFQNVDNPRDNFKQDLFFGPKDLPLADGYMDEDMSVPATDEELGGSSDISAERTEENDYLIYSLQRSFETGDKFDVVFSSDSPYLIKTIKGKFDESGKMTLEYLEKYEYVVLNNFYLDRNDDDHGLYGPWNSKAVSRKNLRSSEDFENLLRNYVGK